MAQVIVTPAMLKGYNTTIFTQADVTAATPTAWTTANSPVLLFTVTGIVYCRIVGVVGAVAFTSTAGTGTLSVGTVGATGAPLRQLTVSGGAVLAATNVWVDETTPNTPNRLLVGATLSWTLINGLNIAVTVATNNMIGGSITLYCDWIPVSAGATVV